MKYFQTLIIFLVLIGMTETGISQVNLSISTTSDTIPLRYDFRLNDSNIFFRASANDTVWINLPANCGWSLAWRTEDKPINEFVQLRKIISVPGSRTRVCIADSFYFTINIQQKIKTISFPQFFQYSVIPGGGRFYFKRPWQGLGIAILQLAPIPFAVYYDDQRQKFYDLAVEAAAHGDQAGLDENFDKSQYFRRLTGFAIGISATATLINIFDVLINVKKTKLVPLVSDDGFRLGIIKNF